MRRDELLKYLGRTVRITWRKGLPPKTFCKTGILVDVGSTEVLLRYYHKGVSVPVERWVHKPRTEDDIEIIKNLEVKPWLKNQ